METERKWDKQRKRVWEGECEKERVIECWMFLFFGNISTEKKTKKTSIITAIITTNDVSLLPAVVTDDSQDGKSREISWKCVWLDPVWSSASGKRESKMALDRQKWRLIMNRLATALNNSWRSEINYRTAHEKRDENAAVDVTCPDRQSDAYVYRCKEVTWT